MSRRGPYVIGVCMDLSKSFDTLDHAILIRKLEYYGLRGVFFIYVNDISYSSNALQYILFADDTNVFCSNSDLNTLLRTINTELPILSNGLKIISCPSI